MTIAHIVFSLLLPGIGPVCAMIASAMLVMPSGLSRTYKLAVSAILFACSFKFLWFMVFGGNMYLPEMPAAAIYTLSILYTTVLLCAAAGIAVFVFRLCMCIAKAIVRHNKRNASTALPARGMRRRDFLLGSVAVASGVGAAISVHEGIRLPDIVLIEIDFPDLPPSFDGYRIAHLSDLHVSAAARADRTQGIVRLTNAVGADAIVITGDMIDGPVAAHRDDVAPLAGLSAPDGVFACTGNHEYYSGYDIWRKVFASLGVKMLENASVTLRRTRRESGETDALSFIGINDMVSGDSDISRASAEAEGFRVLLSHRPIGLPANAAAGVRLQLSGHTHGGAIIGIDRLVARSNEGHVRGLYIEDGITLYVNSGTGQWAGFPERIGIPPEITLITLRGQRANHSSTRSRRKKNARAANIATAPSA